VGTDRNAAFRATSYAKPAAFDAEDDRIRLEFEGLDLTWRSLRRCTAAKVSAFIAATASASPYARRRITRAMFEGGSSFRVRHEAANTGLRSALGDRGSTKTLTSDDIVSGKTRAARYEIERLDVEQRVFQDSGARPVACGRSLTSQLPPRTRSRTFDQAVVLLGRSLLICGSMLPNFRI
jgi:hypothetical protein